MAGADTSVANSASTPASSLRARLVDGTARVFLAEALIVPTGLLTVAYLTRRLDLSEYGRYTLAVALLVWLEWGLAAPFGRAAVRLIGAAPDWRPIASLVVRTQFFVGAVMAVVLWLTAPIVAAAFHEPTLTSLLRWLSLDLPLFGVSHAHQQVLVARGRFRVRALVSLVRWTTRLALIVAAVESGLSVRGVILAIVGTSAVEIAFARRFVRPPIFRRSDVAARRLFEYALPLLVTALSLRLLDRVDVVLLKVLGRSAADVGVYGGAQSLTLATALFTSAFSPLLVATVTRSVVSGDHSRARELARDSMRLVVLLFPLATILAASAREIVPVILGAKYLPGVDVFQCLIVAGVMNVAVSVGCALLVGAGKPAWTLRVAMPLPVIAILAHVWAIPRFGPVGAAAVTMTCAALGAAFAVLAIHHVWHVAPASTSVIRSVVVAIGGAVAAAAWSTPGLLVVVKLGILVLGGLFVLCVAGEFGNPIALASRARHALLGRLVDQQ